MRIDARISFAVAAFALASCSGNFAAGPSQPGGLNPPMPGGSVAPAIATSGPVAASIAKNLGANDAAFPLADASKGFQCPVVGEYSCTLRLNLPVSTPSPAAKIKATPTPKPTSSPSPSPSPSPLPSGVTPSPSPAPVVGDVMKLTIEPQPKEAPALVHIPAGALNVTPLVLVRMQPSADFLLQGDAVAQFTLPKEQIGSRGFVLQLFAETVRHKHRDYRALYTFNKSSLEKTTLTFDFAVPKLTVTKNSVYVFVLYAGGEPSGSPSPKPAVSASP